MPFYFFQWDYEPGGNVEHLAEHGVSPDEAEQVVTYPDMVQVNRHHPDPMFAIGRTKPGRVLGVAYAHRDESTVVVITAFEME